MHTRYTTAARLLGARASTTRHRLEATGTPPHASPTTAQRPLRQPRAKRALPAPRPASLATRQLQRAEEGVAVSLLCRRGLPPLRRPRACRQPRRQQRCPAQKDTTILARHCQLRVGKQRRGPHGGGEQQQGEGTERLGRRARAAHPARRWPTSTMSKRLSKIPKCALEFEVDLAHSSPPRKSTLT